MSFCDAVALFNYWGDAPTITMILHSYFEIEPQSKQDPMKVAKEMMIIGGGRAKKLATAPERDRLRFESLQKQLKERHG